MRTCQFMLLNVICFSCLRSFFAPWTCGGSAAQHLAERKLLVRRPDLGASPGSLSSAHFLWLFPLQSPFSGDRSRWAIAASASGCAKSARSPHSPEAVCRATSAQQLLSFDAESWGWVPHHKDAGSGSLATHLSLAVWCYDKLLWASWPPLPHQLQLRVEKHWWHEAGKSKDSNPERCPCGQASPSTSARP